MKLRLLLSVLLVNSVFASEAWAQVVREKFYLDKPFDNEKQADQFCRAKGYDELETFDTDIRGAYVVCLWHEDRCHPTPVSQLEQDIKGKLFFVHTLPGLSEDGKLLSAFQPKGIHIATTNHWINHGNPIVTADSRSTVHFSINHLVPSDFYADKGNIDRPFVVIIPASQDPKHDIMGTVISASFPEVVTLGDYSLPSNAIIMVRSDKKDALPEFYRKKGFKIIEFDGVEYARKRDAVNRVLRDHGGVAVDMSAPERARPWTYRPVLDQDGTNLNNPDFFKRLFPDRPVAFGDDEITHWASDGEQWRMFQTRTGHRNATYYGEIGFPIEEYQSVKVNNWLKTLNLSKEVLQHHEEINRNHLIAYRAMDYIFDHFKNRTLAFDYIKTHLVSLQESGALERIKSSPGFKQKSIDEAAKEICDYKFLIKQNRIFVLFTKFDLATRDEVVENLVNSAFINMKPNEVRSFFEDFSRRSSIMKHFSGKDQQYILQRAKVTYLCYLGMLFRDAFGPMKSKDTLRELKSHKESIVALYSDVKDFNLSKQEAEIKQELLGLINSD